MIQIGGIMNDKSSSEVLIVGAGPVGLVVASELAQAGVSARIIDRRDQATLHSKANVLWPRSLELLARLGLAEQLISQAHQIQTVKFLRNGVLFAVQDFSELTDTPYPFAITLPQPHTEMLIEQHLRQLGIVVERGAELTKLESVSSGAMATIRHADETIERRLYTWVIGADGSKSTVREQVGISFDGEPVPVTFTLVDAYASGVRTNEGTYHFGSRGSLAIVPIGQGIFRFATSAFALKETDHVARKLQQILEDLGVVCHIDKLRYVAQFHAEVRQASTYRFDHVLISGDAAHATTPASGQGMNVGIQDAVALGWRLTHVILGHLNASVLDQYALERRTDAAKVLAFTRAQTASVDEHKETSSVLNSPSIRQMSQLDTIYGEYGIRIPPLPDTARNPRRITNGVAPHILLHPGATYSAGEWRDKVQHIRSYAPAYFDIHDLAGKALAPRYAGILDDEPTALVVRPDQHLQLKTHPDSVTKETFVQLGWHH